MNLSPIILGICIVIQMYCFYSIGSCNERLKKIKRNLEIIDEIGEMKHDDPRWVGSLWVLEKQRKIN